VRIKKVSSHVSHRNPHESKTTCASNRLLEGYPNPGLASKTRRIRTGAHISFSNRHPEDQSPTTLHPGQLVPTALLDVTVRKPQAGKLVRNEPEGSWSHFNHLFRTRRAQVLMINNASSLAISTLYIRHTPARRVLSQQVR
jgi:hypothetical protein